MTTYTGFLEVDGCFGSRAQFSFTSRAIIGPMVPVKIFGNIIEFVEVAIAYLTTKTYKPGAVQVLHGNVDNRIGQYICKGSRWGSDQGAFYQKKHFPDSHRISGCQVILEQNPLIYECFGLTIAKGSLGPGRF